MSQMNQPYSSASTGGDSNPPFSLRTAAVTPTDRVRWGPIVAGTFIALTTLAVLATLGAAIGLTACDRGDDARNFGLGATIWAALSMIVAFGLGGWITARSMAVRGSDAGFLNGAMVAAFGIPLLLLMLGGFGMMLGQTRLAADDRSGRLGDAAAPAGGMMLPGMGAGTATDRATDVNRDDAVRAGRTAARSSLFGLLLAIASASGAGYMAARPRHQDNDTRRVTATTGGTTTPGGTTGNTSY